MAESGTTTATSTSHGRPSEGAECLITMDDIDETNYCEYQTVPSGAWRPALACSMAIEHLRQTQFKRYMERIEASDCAAEMRRLLTAGPPVWVEEANVMPLPEGDTRIDKLWYMEDGLERSAKLDGALDGEERQTLWDSLKALHADESDDSKPNQAASDS